ncbi:MAG: DUF2797 domain-containing protein [Flavobacterium sp.]|nr:DUF2797 domain-containing protein [Flavobacterium sp.]
MEYQGVLTKMQTEQGQPIQYYLIFEDSFINVNQLIGKEIELRYSGYQCIHCSKKKKIFRQGFCYQCFSTSPSAGDWILRPELSTAHLGIADRDLDYESSVQLHPHTVYLALACEVKVGVTRSTQVPTRWIDQGACSAITVVEVPNRYLAGLAEVALKEYYVDKTNWRRMLCNDVTPSDLLAERRKVESYLPEEVREFYYNSNPEIVEIQYPVTEYPKKVQGLNLEKTPYFRGKLIGIRGQYLIFNDGTVFNVRAAEGSIVQIGV